MKFTGTELEAWCLLFILMIAFEIDSGMQAFPFALTHQMSKDLGFTLSQVYMSISIGNLPNCFLPILIGKYVQEKPIRILIIAKILIAISWVFTTMAFHHKSLFEVCIGRIINQLGNFLEFSAVVF